MYVELGSVGVPIVLYGRRCSPVGAPKRKKAIHKKICASKNPQQQQQTNRLAPRDLFILKKENQQKVVYIRNMNN